MAGKSRRSAVLPVALAALLLALDAAPLPAEPAAPKAKAAARAVVAPSATPPAAASAAAPAAPPTQADLRRTPVVRVVQQAGPAVVSLISARAAKDAPFAAKGDEKPEGDKNSKAPTPAPAPAPSMGSGVIIDGAKAHVLTNAHVITGATKITAKLMDGRSYTAMVIGADQDTDLAVLRLELPRGAEPLPQARMGDSAGLMIGETVVAIGNPFGLSHTVTTGVVSALDRSLDTRDAHITGLIQTDAAINPGNSGGPLLNILGEVVGINAAVHTRGGGLGFAIPIDRAKRVLDELIATGRVAHIWLGLLGEDMTPEQMTHYGLARPGGLVVTAVLPGTPAEAAGIRPGDALLAIGGQRVRDKGQFLGTLMGYTRGDTLAVLLSRGPVNYQVQMRPKVLDREAGLGLIKWRWGFTPAKPEAGEAKPGVAVGEVGAGGPGAALGLKPGDRILQVGTLPVRTDEDLLKAFYRYQMHRQLLLSVKRGENTYTVRLKV